MFRQAQHKLGLGEAEGISLCRRLGMVFVTHDRKAANFCDRAGVKCLHFRTLIEALEKRGLLSFVSTGSTQASRLDRRWSSIWS
jgi:predicted nucleic acid-binding protein